MATKLTGIEVKEIIRLHIDEKKNSTEIGKIFNRHPDTMLRIIRRHGIEFKRQYWRKYKNKNNQFFDAIDSEAKAYFLGLICADGGIKNRTIKIKLQERDGYILERLATEMLMDISAVKYKKSSCSDGYNRQNTATLLIVSTHMVETLKSYNISERKSFTLDFPECVPDSLIHHFIRGYFDGDGSISKYTNQSVECPSFATSIICSPLFGKKLNEIILNKLNLKLQYVYDYRYSQEMVYCKTAGVNKPYRWLNWMYRNSTIYLNRKFEKYQDLEKYNEISMNRVKQRKERRNSTPLSMLD